jgi:hypothetical protein
MNSRSGSWKVKISGLNLIVEAPSPSRGALHQPRYGPAEIVTLLEGQQLAGSLARTVEAFWPTIKAALLAYEQSHPRRSRRFGSLD